MRLSAKGLFRVFLLVTSSILVLPDSSRAQLSEDFNSNFAPSGWSAPVGSGTAYQGQVKWYRGDDAALDSSFGDGGNAGLDPGRGGSGYCAVFNSFYLDLGVRAELSWDNLDFSSYATAQLQFYMKNTQGSDVVFIKARNGTASYTYFDTLGIYADWTLVTVSLNAMCSPSNTTVDVVFEGKSDWGATNIGIDDVSLSTTPVPVQLASFSASANRAAAELKWTTATEVNNYGFEVERRQIGASSQQIADNWLKIGFVPGSGTSTSPREYTFVDQNLPSGRYAYRIKQVDLDGTSTYYGNAEVEIAAAKTFALEPNYPNPFNPSTTLSFTLEEDAKATLRVFNVMGQEVATLFDETGSAGRLYQVNFNASQLPSGVYFARLDAGKQQTMRKMLLVK